MNKLTKLIQIIFWTIGFSLMILGTIGLFTLGTLEERIISGLIAILTIGLTPKLEITLSNKKD